jgi:Heme/copper-type cytochrome/quinol oxidases, subunit 2
MMYGFIDSASEHAVALLHFHNYAMFFLVLIVVFVIWLLKMILRFVFVERNLNLANDSSVLSSYVNFFFDSSALTFQNFLLRGELLDSELSNDLEDFRFLFFSLLNVKKTYYSYALKRTKYPDQKSVVNIFPIFPVSNRNDYFYKRFNSVGNIMKFSGLVTGLYMKSVLKVFRAAFHDIAYLFPYERIDIPHYDPYKTLDHFIVANIYMNAFVLSVKHEVQSALYTSNANDSWFLKNYFVNKLFGFSHNRHRVFFKTMSNFYVPSSLFFQFYTNDKRMFFYLFFQHVRHRKVLEWVWTCVPALTLLLLLYPSLILLYCYDRPHITKPYFTFKAIGHQWYWSYEYSDFATTRLPELNEHIKFDSYMVHMDDLQLGEFRLLEVDNRVVLPIGVCSRLIATAADVLHSWAVPALGVKIDAIPGRLNQFWVVVDRPGTFYGQCSELCGVNHGFMPIVVEAAPFITFFKAINAMYSAA